MALLIMAPFLGVGTGLLSLHSHLGRTEPAAQSRMVEPVSRFAHFPVEPPIQQAILETSERLKGEELQSPANVSSDFVVAPAPAEPEALHPHESIVSMLIGVQMIVIGVWLASCYVAGRRRAIVTGLSQFWACWS